MRKAYYFHGNIFKFLFKKNRCPWCDGLLSKKINHKIVNSKSQEADKYSELYGTIDGGHIVGNFDSDIRHHVFYCGTCDKEIEHKTLFSYEKTKKNISRLIDTANEKGIEMEVQYLDKEDNEIKKENKNFFSKVLISLVINESKIEKVCYIACKYPTYEQAIYFKKTSDFRDVREILKKG
ncbi:MAG: hypothetical protein RBQ70_05720 [Acholeplasma sp.]|jgi:hypothetical protein|nr:hypothetical protein [Acholeplasma sp.]